MNTAKLALVALIVVLVASVLSGCTVRRYIDSTRRYGNPYVQNGTEIKTVGPITVVTVYGPKGSAEARRYHDRHYPHPAPIAVHVRRPVRTEQPAMVASATEPRGHYVWHPGYYDEHRHFVAGHYERE